MPSAITVVQVKSFLNFGQTRPIEMKEMTEFWKSCSDEEKESFKVSVEKWDGKTFFC